MPWTKTLMGPVLLASDLVCVLLSLSSQDLSCWWTQMGGLTKSVLEEEEEESWKSLLKAKQFYLAKFRKLGNLLGWETPKFVRELQWNWLQEFEQQKIMLWVSVGKTIGRVVEIPELPPYTTCSSHSPRFCFGEMKKDIQWNTTCMGCALQNCQTKTLFCKFADYHQFPFHWT